VRRGYHCALWHVRARAFVKCLKPVPETASNGAARMGTSEEVFVCASPVHDCDCWMERAGSA